MKNLLKIGSLSLALVAVVFMMNAKASTGDLQLQITGTSGSCIYGTTLNLGATVFDYAAKTVSGNFLASGSSTQWSCTDSAGVASWALTMQASDIRNMTTNVTAHTIWSGRIHIESPLAAVVSGACTSVGGANVAGTAINAATTLISKASQLGDACRVATSSVDLTVDLTGSQAIGQYSGTLTIGVPSL